MHKILVIGSVHLDIVAQIDPKTSENLDKIGLLHYAVGGTAFNVAANLAYHDVSVVLYSCIKCNSLSGQFIRNEVAKRGLSLNAIKEVIMPTESAFVAHMKGIELISAVSCNCIQDVDFDYEELQKLIIRSNLVAIECNLATDQIRRIMQIAKKYHKPVCISGVSESKVARIAEVGTDSTIAPFSFSILNESEAGKMLSEEYAADANYICKTLNSDNVIITLGRQGFRVVTKGGSDKCFEAPVQTVKSTLGAGDAMFAGFCNHFAAKSQFDPSTIVNELKKFLGPVLASEEATPPVTTVGRNWFRILSAGAYPVITVTCLVVCLAVIVFGLFSRAYSPMLFGAMLFGVPGLAGAAGSSIEQLLLLQDRIRYECQSESFSMVQMVLGFSAGTIGGLFFVVAQIMNNEKFQLTVSAIPEKMSLLLPFCVITGFISGIAADAFLKRLQGLKTRLIATPDYSQNPNHSDSP